MKLSCDSLIGRVCVRSTVTRAHRTYGVVSRRLIYTKTMDTVQKRVRCIPKHLTPSS